MVGELARIRTYVIGLDERLEGGIPQGHVVLLCGGPGSLKSTFAFNILYNSARTQNLKGVYITLEESKNLLIRRTKKMGFDIDQIPSSVTIVDIGQLRKKLRETEAEKSSWLTSLMSAIINLRKTFEFQVLVIDSLNALYAISAMKNPRDELYHFFEQLRELNMTTFLISEMKIGDMQFGKHEVEEFLCDGIIHLELRPGKTGLSRYIGVVKMRDTAHDLDYFPLIISRSKGFEIVTK